MDAFLTFRFQTLESVADIRSTFSNSHPPNPNKSNNIKKANSPETKKLNSYSTNVAHSSEKCALCHQLHPLRLCPSFLSLSVEGRFSVVKQQKRCTNCLGTSHEYKQCKSKFLCNICKKKHHSLLHRYQPNSTPNQPRAMPQNPPIGAANSSAKPSHIRENHPPQQLNTTPSTSKDATTRELQSYSTQFQSPSNSVILGTALVDVYRDDIKCTVRALIDSASEATFISKKLQMKLGLRTRPLQVDVHGLNDSLTATSTQICNIKIGSPVDKLFETQVDAFVVRKLTGQLPYFPSSAFDSIVFSNLPLADTYRQACGEIDLLLGGDVYPLIIRDGLQWSNNQAMVAQKTVFGWIVTGKVKNNPYKTSVISFFNELALSNQIQRFWELEEIPRKSRSSPEDSYCESLYQSTTFRNNEGRYVVSLPFRQEYPENLNIGTSRNIALSQFVRNEAK